MILARTDIIRLRDLQWEMELLQECCDPDCMHRREDERRIKEIEREIEAIKRMDAWP